jgi:uncharacterized protein (TIGR02444 family)
MTGRERFWDYSLRVYGLAGVANACLSLQDRFGLDINLLLYCCWLGANDRVLDPATLGRADEFARPWADNVVKPLRAARRWMKHRASPSPISSEDYAQLRGAIKALELSAERLQQQVLEHVADSGVGQAPQRTDPLSTMVANVRRYLGTSAIDGDPSGSEALVILLAAAAGVDADKARRAFADEA